MTNDRDFQFLQGIDPIGKLEVIGKAIQCHLPGLVNTYSTVTTVIFFKFEDISIFKS